MFNLNECPWSFFAQQIDLHPFCERRVCGWIVEPANTWTNIGYLIAAVLIFYSRTPSSIAKRIFFISTFALFIGSTLFHMSGTVFGKMVDVSTMFFLSSGLLILSFNRIFHLKNKFLLIGYSAILTPSLAFLFIFKVGNMLFATHIAAIVIAEVYILKKKLRSLDFKKFIYALLAAASGFGFWLLDVNGFMCNPENHILTGHGIWHLLCAGAIYLLYQAYQSSVDAQVGGEI